MVKENTEQKHLVVTSRSEFSLTHYLKDGWKVIHTCPMPSSGHDRNYEPTCLVILERTTYSDPNDN